jgi:hypothetical protein
MNATGTVSEMIAGLITDVRAFREPSADACRELLTLDNLDAVRNAAGVDDLDAVIWLLLTAEAPAMFRIAIHMLQGLNMRTSEREVRARIRGLLEGAWLNARNDTEKGWSTAAALLDNPDLPLFLREEILNFYLRTWDEGRAYMTRLVGGADRILEWVGKRLADPRFPVSKHWAYVLVLGYNPDREGVEQLISRLKPSGDPLVTRVIAEVRTRLSLEHPRTGTASAGLPTSAARR